MFAGEVVYAVLCQHALCSVPVHHACWWCVQGIEKFADHQSPMHLNNLHALGNKQLIIWYPHLLLLLLLLLLVVHEYRF